MPIRGPRTSEWSATTGLGTTECLRHTYSEQVLGNLVLKVLEKVLYTSIYRIRSLRWLEIKEAQPERRPLKDRHVAGAVSPHLSPTSAHWYSVCALSSLRAHLALVAWFGPQPHGT